jgi:fucose permease
MSNKSIVKGRGTLILAFACFTAQGVVNGLLGLAWPSMRQTFGLPLDALGVLLISSTLGYVAGSVLVGRVMARIGIGRFLMMANILAALGLWGYALSPGWWLLVSLGLITGAMSGAIGVGLNIYVAATRSVRTMNWMHASYGIGATLGPLLMTVILSASLGWRFGYVVAGAVHLALGLSFIFALQQLDFRGTQQGSTTANGETFRPVATTATLRMPIVLLSILLFLLYTGVESTTGQWSYSLFIEARSISPYLAGIMTSVFWGMLTVGRIVFGAAADRVGIERLLRLSMVGTLVAAVLFLLPSQLVSLITIGLMGLSLSAIFPTLTADTPKRVGSSHASNTIGLQTGAASVGFAILPGLAGYLAGRMGLEIIAPLLAISALLMNITNECALWLVRRRRLSEKAIPQLIAD